MMEPICNMVTDNVYLSILCQIIVYIKSTVKFISTPSSTVVSKYITENSCTQTQTHFTKTENHIKSSKSIVEDISWTGKFKNDLSHTDHKF